MKPRCLLLLPLLLVLAPSSPAEAANETYELRVHAACLPGTKVCGFPSEDAFRIFACRATQEVNLQFLSTGISFRPTVVFEYDEFVSQTTGCGADYQHPVCFGMCTGGAFLGRTCRDNNDCPGAVCDTFGSNFGLACVPSTECPKGICRAGTCAGVCTGGEAAAQEPCDADSDCPDAACDKSGARFGQSCAAECPDGVCRNPREFWVHRVAKPLPGATAGISVLATDNGGAYACNGIPALDPNPPQPPAITGYGADEVVIAPIWAHDGTSMGYTWAHELGHYWCLQHTQANNDFPCSPQCDDTPPDPAPCPKNPKTSCCTATAMPADAGSPHATYCTLACQDADGKSVTLDPEPLSSNAMSYYGNACTGPYLLNSEFYSPFTPQQLQTIVDCHADYQRTLLVDVCETRGGDIDGDGICDDDDNCPLVMNTCQVDRDTLAGNPAPDGLGDECDLCPDDPTPTEDFDGDGIGDACDPDIDDDGCLNRGDTDDQHFFTLAYAEEHPGCNPSVILHNVPDGQDTDGDGLRNCADPDDDDDTVPDAADACPLDQDRSSVPCLILPGPDCHHDPHAYDWHVTCPNCPRYNEFVIKIETIDPRVIEIDNFYIVNGSLYLFPPSGQTLAQLGNTLTQPIQAGALVRIALWSRGDLAGPAGEAGGVGGNGSPEDRFIGLVTAYDPALVGVPRRWTGRLLEITPASGGAPIIRPVWAVAADPAFRLADDDADGVPNFADNCVAVANPRQTDTDGERYGNACDADVDEDATVTERDVSAIRACAGVDLSVAQPVLELDECRGDCDGDYLVTIDELVTAVGIALGQRGEESCAAADTDQSRRVTVNELLQAVQSSLAGCPSGSVEPQDREKLERAIGCRSGDLDDNSVIDGQDVEIAMRALGGRPGPSGFRLD